MTEDLSRLSLNTATTKRWTLPEAVEGAVRAGIPALGLWRDRVEEVGTERAAQIVHDAGVEVSSLCRGGFLTDPDPDRRVAALEDNRAAVRQAATVRAPELVLVVGGLPAATAPGGPARRDGNKDLRAARQRVADGLGDLVPYAREHGVRLALEPLHPLFAADRAVLSTLGQCLDLAEEFAPEEVGVVIDTYHVWWDPQLRDQIERAGATGRIASYQICDWVLPLAADPLLSRGHVGDGYIDFPTVTRWVRDAGYDGPVEVEIFNQSIWDTDGNEVLHTLIGRYLELVQPHLSPVQRRTG